MGANLKGLSGTLKNKIYQAKKKGIDTSFIPRGYSKLPDTQLLNLINRLGQATDGTNYSYQGIHNTITPKIPKSKAKKINYPKELIKQVKEGQLTPTEARELGQRLMEEVKYHRKLIKKYPDPNIIKESLGREFFPFQHGLNKMAELTTKDAIMNIPRLSKGAKSTLNDLRNGKHLYDIEKDLNKFDISKENFAILDHGNLQGSGLARKVNGIYRKLSAENKMKFLAKFHANFWEEYADDLVDADMSYDEMYEGLLTLINDIKRGV